MQQQSRVDKVVTVATLIIATLSIPLIAVMYAWATVTAHGVTEVVAASEANKTLITLLVGALGGTVSFIFMLVFAIRRLQQKKTTAFITLMFFTGYALCSLGSLYLINFFGV